MANRYLQQFSYWFDRSTVHLIGKIEISASAAVSGFSIKGVASVTKSGTGEYTITLQDAYNSLLAANFSIVAATAVDLVPQIKSYNVTSSSKTIVINLNAGATPTNPAAALTILVDITCKNSSV